VLESAAYIWRLEKQQSFLKSKGKDMVRRGLKIINKLNKAKEKEKQIEFKQVVSAAMLSSNLILGALALRVEPNLFTGLEVLLLPPKV
jgi:TATA-box binding protein (TBP) (component of TFIID and TFIIIB)